MDLENHEGILHIHCFDRFLILDKFICNYGNQLLKI